MPYFDIKEYFARKNVFLSIQHNNKFFDFDIISGRVDNGPTKGINLHEKIVTLTELINLLGLR
jgi:hypothetical protein